MPSKDKILKSIREQSRPAAALPAYPANPLRYDDPVANFSTVLQQIGGTAIRVKNLAEASYRIGEHPELAAAKELVNCVSGISIASERCRDLNSINDPHELERIDVAILPGEFCVAENAAIWCTDDKIKHRVVFFLSQHIVIVVPTDVVHNMHEAYTRLSFDQVGFGMFLAGPSKTADIEQSLVIGAHGARSLVVYLVDELG
jgi:L-lactate dehydrogenase complex protein LldG